MSFIFQKNGNGSKISVDNYINVIYHKCGNGSKKRKKEGKNYGCKKGSSFNFGIIRK